LTTNVLWKTCLKLFINKYMVFNQQATPSNWYLKWKIPNNNWSLFNTDWVTEL
jgi:hypothetical protein